MEESGDEEEWTGARYRNQRRTSRRLYSTAVRNNGHWDSGLPDNSSTKWNYDRPRRHRGEAHGLRWSKRHNYDGRIQSDQIMKYRQNTQSWRNRDLENGWTAEGHKELRDYAHRRPNYRKKSWFRGPRQPYRRDHREEEIQHGRRNERRPRATIKGNMELWNEENRTDFIKQVRLFHKMIKTNHHLKNLTQNQAPKAIRSITQYLMNIIKPAMPTEPTLDLIQGNARNWEITTMIILSDHYKDLMDTFQKDLQSTLMEDWTSAFEVAANWSRRRLGRRLLQESIQEMREVIKTQASRNGKKNRDRLTTETPGPRRQRTTYSQTDERFFSSPRLKGLTVTAQVHGLPNPTGEMTPGLTEVTQISSDEDRQQRTNEQTAAISNSPMAQRTRQRNPRRDVSTSEAASSRTPSPGNTSCIKDMDYLPFLTTAPSAQAPQGCVYRSNMEITLPTSSSSSSVSSPGKASNDGDPEAPTGMDRPHSRHQAQQTNDWKETVSGTSSAEKDPRTPRFKPTRHINTDRKKKDWYLNIQEKHIILGDSNVAKIPPFKFLDLQIDSFPGATFRHMHGVLEKIEINQEVQTVIFSLGINNRKQKLQTTIKEIQRLYKIASEKFPNAEIVFPQLNFAKNLPFREQEFLQNLNRHLKQKYSNLTELPKTEFHTEKDGIHWTHKTAERILQHWIDQGN